MKPTAVALAAALVIPTICTADEFTDFRIPEHSWRSAAGSLMTQLDNTGASANWVYGQASSNSRGTELGALQFEQGHDDDRRQWSWSFYGAQQLIAGRGRLQFDNAPLLNFRRERDWMRASDQSLRWSAHQRWYPRTQPLGLDLAAVFTGRWNEQLEGQDVSELGPGAGDRLDNRQRLHANRYLYDAGVAATIGHGIVRDATVVEDVHVLETRLRETGTLTRALSVRAREQLAGLLVVAPYLQNAHERPARYLWREIERVLREDGALVDGKPDAYGQQLAFEPYLFLSTRRLTGHFVGLVTEMRETHIIDRQANDAWQNLYTAGTLTSTGEAHLAMRRDDETTRAYVGVGGEWHRAAGWRWQWDAIGNVLMAARSHVHGLSTQAMLAGGWHIANRWQLQTVIRHDRDYLEVGDLRSTAPYDRWNIEGSATLEYFLEDHVTAFASFADAQGAQRVTAGGAGPLAIDFFSRVASLRLGVAYRFLGRVSAPGLIGAMRPL